MATPGSRKRRLSTDTEHTNTPLPAKKLLQASAVIRQDQELSSSLLPSPTQPQPLPSSVNPTSLFPPCPASSDVLPSLRHPHSSWNQAPPPRSPFPLLPPIPGAPTSHDRRYVNSEYSELTLAQWMLEQKRWTYTELRSESMRDRAVRVERKTRAHTQELPVHPTQVFVWGESSDGEYYFAHRWLAGPIALPSLWEKYNRWERKYNSFSDTWELCAAFTELDYLEGFHDPDQGDEDDDAEEEEEDVDSLPLEIEDGRPMFLPVKQRERYVELARANMELTRGETYIEANLNMSFRSIKDHSDQLHKLLQVQRTLRETAHTNESADDSGNAKPLPVTKLQRDIAWLRMGLANVLHKVRIANTRPPWIGIVVRILKGYWKGADAKVLDVLPLRVTFTGIELVLEVLNVAGSSSSPIMDLDDVCLIDEPHSGHPLALVYRPTNLQCQNFPILNRDYLRWAQGQLGKRHQTVAPKPLITVPRPATPPAFNFILSPSDDPFNRASPPPQEDAWEKLLSMASAYIDKHGGAGDSSSPAGTSAAGASTDWRSTLSVEHRAMILVSQSLIEEEATAGPVPNTHWLYPMALRDAQMQARLDNKTIRVRASVDVHGKLQIIREDLRNYTLSEAEVNRLVVHCPLRGSHGRLLVVRGQYIGKYVRRVVKSEVKDSTLTVRMVVRGNYCTSDVWLSDERITLSTRDVTADWEPQRDRDASHAFVQNIIANYNKS